MGINDNLKNKKELLKHMILQLHSGEAPELVRKRLVEVLKDIPYDEVVEVEQELINEGLPEEEVLKFCDIHTMVLDGHIDTSGAKKVSNGHPVDTFLKENEELLKVADQLELLFSKSGILKNPEVKQYVIQVRYYFNLLMDVDKHYRRKENLVFPYLEKYEITGPPKVMWGKHDETRLLLKTAIESLDVQGEFMADEIQTLIELVLKPAVQAVADMTMKEEQILFPMTLDKLIDAEWYEIYRQTNEIGYCLYDPKDEWMPEGLELKKDADYFSGNIQMLTGALSPGELTAIFNTLPIDVTFVDKDDKVKYFSLGKHRIFDRNRAIIGRDVRLCHPPSSVHIVEQILADFKSGKENSSAFWINMKGRFIYIEYFAVRDKDDNYIGTLEYTQDLTEMRKLEGEQRLLSYTSK
jgi:uncharacterized protein